MLLQIARERERWVSKEGSSASLMMRWNCLLGVVDRHQFDLYVRTTYLVCRVIYTSLVPYISVLKPQWSLLSISYLSEIFVTLHTK